MNATTDIKAAVAAAFSAAADTYDQNAHVQREIAARLAARIALLPLPMRPRILEIGCGTGFLCGELRPLVRNAEWVLADISEAMLARCRQNFGDDATYVTMDGEYPALPGPGFDLICSSLAFQWFDDLGAAMKRLAGLLKPGGYLAYATLAADSFQEWRRAHEALGLAPGTPRYPSCNDLKAMGATVEEERFTRRYDSGHAFLEHWRQIGADLPLQDRAPLSAGALRRVLRQFAPPAGIEITYHVAYGWLKRS